MTTPADIINKRLQQLGRSRYWLSQELADEVSTSAPYKWCAGEQDPSCENFLLVLDVLDLEIRPKR